VALLLCQVERGELDVGDVGQPEGELRQIGRRLVLARVIGRACGQGKQRGEGPGCQDRPSSYHHRTRLSTARMRRKIPTAQAARTRSVANIPAVSDRSR